MKVLKKEDIKDKSEVAVTTFGQKVVLGEGS